MNLRQYDLLFFSCSPKQVTLQFAGLHVSSMSRPEEARTEARMKAAFNGSLVRVVARAVGTPSSTPLPWVGGAPQVNRGKMQGWGEARPLSNAGGAAGGRQIIHFGAQLTGFVCDLWRNEALDSPARPRSRGEHAGSVGGEGRAPTGRITAHRSPLEAVPVLALAAWPSLLAWHPRRRRESCTALDAAECTFAVSAAGRSRLVASLRSATRTSKRPRP